MVQPDRGYGKRKRAEREGETVPSSQVYLKLVGSVLRLLLFNFSACLDYKWSPGLMCLNYQSEICWCKKHNISLGVYGIASVVHQNNAV